MKGDLLEVGLHDRRCIDFTDYHCYPRKILLQLLILGLIKIF